MSSVNVGPIKVANPRPVSHEGLKFFFRLNPAIPRFARPVYADLIHFGSIDTAQTYLHRGCIDGICIHNLGNGSKLLGASRMKAD
jgi:hypothetical protein